MIILDFNNAWMILERDVLENYSAINRSEEQLYRK